MEGINTGAVGTDVAARLLKQTMNQSGEMAMKLIQSTAETTININQLEHMGKAIDTYC